MYSSTATRWRYLAASYCDSVGESRIIVVFFAVPIRMSLEHVASSDAMIEANVGLVLNGVDSW